MKLWMTIKEISKSKISTSCALWIFIVPAIAKLSTVIGTHGYNDFTFKLVAPHSFILLYFAAISFFLGTLLYTLACPPFLKAVDNYNDFEKLKMTEFNLSQSLEKFSKIRAEEIISIIRKKIGKANITSIDSDQALLIEAGDSLDSIMVESKNLIKCFWLVHDYHQSTRLVFQYIIMIFYLCGFGILLYILASNLFIVLNTI
ncbi:hypothetical protein CJF25_06510 [Photobacterium phosphoreum]|uniref:hypothetical protein n=1 Tax=Photobacterium phosphoreum TaxID=659 RepID=UPI001E51D42A|nr:hypothetical protein [Photobacterium phosphoreum]MCD9462646.1 hypothetical protein [Photobacterium phosphoreum]